MEEDVGRAAEEEPQEARPIDGEIAGDGREPGQGVPEEARWSCEEVVGPVLHTGTVLPGNLEVLRWTFYARMRRVREGGPSSLGNGNGDSMTYQRPR